MRRFWTVMILLLTSNFLDAQDPHFSQFYSSPLNLNPALTGIIDGQYRFHAIYRDQWRSLGVPYKTFSASADIRYHIANKDFYSFGVKLVNDAAGDSGFRQTSGHLSGSYMKQLKGGSSDHFLIGGVQVGLAQNSMEWGSLWFGEQFDFMSLSENLNLPSGEPGILTNTGRTEMYLDMGGGLAWFTSWDKRKSFIGGFALSHFNQPRVSFLNDTNVQLNWKWTVHANAELPINRVLSIMPGLMAQLQDPHYEVVLGSNFRFYQENRDEAAIRVGTWFRVASSIHSVELDAMIIVAMYEFNRMVLGLSYDVTLSGLSEANARNGGLEFSLSYVFPYTHRKYSINCPKM